MSINQSDYNKSGIFIEENNGSAANTTAPQEAIVNFVPGFSRKGTVFNRPVLIKKKTDRNAYFGDIDRFLEKKGSFFHRTIEVALQTAPVWAMNLLKTTSLDTLNYASVSVSAQYDNDVIKTRQYDDFFNKSGFWQRDTESFLFFAKNTDRMIHFTNVGDKKLTVFMFKSSIAGFDITAEVWYGGKANVPTWMNYNDLISDYLVRVLVVSGDWSNYTQLAVDSNWSKYFNASGLRKTKVNEFKQDKNVTILGDYNGSLIPYFLDGNKKNIFIETLINLDTDKTGLFCSYDIDAVETDFPTGVVDIIGQTLVDNDKSKINFMSYVDTIEETDVYNKTDLDTLGNVIGIGGIGTRTTDNINGILNDVTMSAAQAPAVTYDPVTVTEAVGSFAIINNTKIELAPSLLNTVTLTFNPLVAPVITTKSTYRIDLMYMDSTGVVSVIEGTQVEFTESTAEGFVTGLTYPAAYPNNSILLGYNFVELHGAGTTSPLLYEVTYVPVACDTLGYVPLTIGSAATDIIVANTASNVLDITFDGTATATKANYKEYRRLQFFNELSTKYTLANSVLIDSTGKKVDLANASIVISNVGDKNIVITVASGFNIESAPTAGNLVFYYNDNEFIMGTQGLVTKSTVGTVTEGVVAKNSEFYLDFYNGMINTGDYFYEKIAVTAGSLKFVHYTNLTFPSAIGDYVIISTADATSMGLSVGANNFSMLIQDAITNAGTFSVGFGSAYDGTPTVGSVEEALQADGYLSAGKIAFAISELVTTETTSTGINIYDANKKVTLKMYSVGSVLNVQFIDNTDNLMTAQYTITNPSLNTDINVFSGEAGYEQTLEIEQHASYTITDNKFLIDLTRYPEVKVGDYVKAYVNTADLQPSEESKKFARILKKTPWSGNALNGVQYAEITTDVKVDIKVFGTNDLQTTRYTTIENYIDTYKAITLNGFTVQATSIPDNTETRQAEILDIIGKNTSLYNAIVNKNKFNFRYLIDSFGLGLNEFSKQQLADIAGKRKNCIAFLNMPSAKMFKNSSNPSFINTDGTLNLEYVRLGGNPDQNPAFLYSLAQGDGKDDGRDASGYFFPYVTVNDAGRPLDFPPASYVANTYMRKNNSSIAGKYNFTVAAGSEDGKILGISNTEMDFTEFDYEQMYKMGINPISYAKNIGHYIETEFTASTVPLSALSYLHVREILIDLENELYAMLFKYQYKFNIPAIRAKIKREADDICQKFLDKGAITSFENIIDDTNNTADLIDNSFGLLETYITPVKALEKIVNIINVNANGTVADSTGFGA